MSDYVALELVWDAKVEEERNVLLYARGDKITAADLKEVQRAGWAIAKIDSDDERAMNAALAEWAKEAVSHEAEPEVAGSPRATESAVEVAELRARIEAFENGTAALAAAEADVAAAEAKDARIAELEAALAAATAEPETAPEPPDKEEPVKKPETKDVRGPKEPAKKKDA